MPITPFHFGPGALVKVIAPKHFSWTIFALANVVIDLEPVSLFFLIGVPAHPWLHTLPGALGVAAIAALFGRQACEYVLRWWNRQLAPGWQSHWLAVDTPISKTTAWFSALVGTLSHIALDSIMHLDVHSLWPFVKGNPMQGSISIEHLHLLCVGTAVAALVAWLLSRAIASR